MSSFINFHLTISRLRFEQEKQAGTYSENRPGLTVEEVSPDLELVEQLLLRVGEPWGWHRRPKYAIEKTALRKRVSHPEARLFMLRDGETAVGYCLCTRPARNLKSIYAAAVSQESVIEIENFGLFPEHTGKRYGGSFLPQIFDKLFKTYDVVYLSSRSTNHAKVIPFYRRLGMSVVHQEILPDDLLPTDAVPSGTPRPASLKRLSPSRL